MTLETRSLSLCRTALALCCFPPGHARASATWLLCALPRPVRRPLAAAAAFLCLARHRVFLLPQLRFPELRARSGWSRGLPAAAVAEPNVAAAAGATPEAAVQALLQAAGAGAGGSEGVERSSKSRFATARGCGRSLEGTV